MKTIYREMLNEIAYLEIPENAYENDTTMEKWENYLNTFLEMYLPKEVIQKAKIAIFSFCRQGQDYVLHKFKEYYALSQITSEWQPQTISSYIKVFDKTTSYPEQEIEVTLDWVYHY